MLGRFIIRTLLVLAFSECSFPAEISSTVCMLVGGEAHDFDELPKLLAKRITTEVAKTVSLEFRIERDVNLFLPANLGKCSLLVLNVCLQALPAEQIRKGLLEAVNSGLPLVALHCTFWSFQQWPEFRGLIGGVLAGHYPYEPLCAKATLPDHPLLRGVSAEFLSQDEAYFINDRSTSAHVLLQTCRTYPGRTSPEPLVWFHEYGRKRVFSMSLGHDLASQRNPNYIRLLSNGILWALRKLD